MIGLMRWSIWIYAALLPLYPAELRQAFGADMTAAFAEDLEDAALRRGIAAVVRVWWRAARELVHIALPAQFGKPMVAVPLVIFAVSETMWSLQMLLATHAKPGIFPLHLVPFVVGVPSLARALTSMAVVYAGGRSLPSPLRLGGHHA